MTLYVPDQGCVLVVRIDKKLLKIIFWSDCHRCFNGITHQGRVISLYRSRPRYESKIDWTRPDIFMRSISGVVDCVLGDTLLNQQVPTKNVSTHDPDENEVTKWSTGLTNKYYVGVGRCSVYFCQCEMIIDDCQCQMWTKFGRQLTYLYTNLLSQKAQS